MKKMFFAALFLFPLLLCYPAAIRESASSPETDFEWRIDDKKVTITGYTGESLDVVIPERIQGYQVTRIESNAFREKGLVSVALPDTITRIGTRAFSGNSLQDISLPENLLAIGGYAFASNKLSSITIPQKVIGIGRYAFVFNPLEEVIIKSKELSLMPHYVFHLNLPGFLPPGRYILLGRPIHIPSIYNYDVWFIQNADGTNTSIGACYDKLVNDDKSIISNLMYVAIDGRDFSLFRKCLGWGVDVHTRIFDNRTPLGNTPLALTVSGFRQFDSRIWGGEIAELLLKAGAVPQYWMLSLSYYHPLVTRALLEHGALTTPESSEHGDPPGFYERPESLLLHYSLQLQGKSHEDPVIASSAEVLLEYGEDANYRDPLTGQTPLGVALNSSHHSERLVDVLLKNMTRPLSLDEYRLMIRRNKEAEGRKNYDVRILEDIQKGFLDPGSKDEDGRDIFYYAATTGTVDLIEGLMPYLIETGRLTPAAGETSLYIDASNAGNVPVATILFSATDKAFTTAKDDSGNEYPIEYYAYDYETIYNSAQRVPEFSLYQTGPGGTRPVGISSGGADPDSRSEFTVHYRANEFYTIGPDIYYGHTPNLLLRTTKGAILNLSEIINKKREQKPNNVNPEWHIVGIFDNMLFVHNNSYHTGIIENILIDISSAVPSVYIMDDKNLNVRSAPDYSIYAWGNFLDKVMDSVFDQNRDKAYLIKSAGEVLVFNVEADTLQLEQTVSWRDCRIPGWKDGERVFVDGETVEAYNFATGTVRSLGTHMEAPRGRIARGYYLYEDEQGHRLIVEAKTGRVYPEPDEAYYNLSFFESGYAYTDEKYRNITLCYFEASRPLDAQLKRKLVLFGSVIGYSFSWNVDRGKMYFNTSSLAFTVDLRTGQVNKAFNTQHPQSNNGINVYMFPFGADDIVYTETLHGGK